MAKPVKRIYRARLGSVIYNSNRSGLVCTKNTMLIQLKGLERGLKEINSGIFNGMKDAERRCRAI